VAENKEVPDSNIGVPPVRKYANYRTLCIYIVSFPHLGNLVKPSGETLGALDLGGGSAQIVFKPMSKVSVGFSLSMTLCVNW
jgi:hypothetical protein